MYPAWAPYDVVRESEVDVLELKGRLAVVTGGASGMGAAVVEHLQRDGVKVASLDLQSGGPADLAFECDVADEASLAAGMDAAVAGLGGLHYAFVNAGGQSGIGSMLSMPVTEWDRVLRVNLRGAFMTLQLVGQAIRDTGDGGAIVATTSTCAILADVGFVHYSVAKAGVQQMVRVAARELAPFGIRVNAVAPGPTLTPLLDAAAGLDGWQEAYVSHTPFGRMGLPDDIADAVLALFAMEWVTGQMLAADGGITLTSPQDLPGISAESLAGL